MQELQFTVEEVLEFAERGEIEEWVHIFLTTKGGNKPFSDGLKLAKRYWVVQCL